MSTVEEITAAIAQLSPEQVGRIRAWLNERAEAEWDRQIEQDERVGKLNALAERALAEHQRFERPVFKSDNPWLRLPARPPFVLREDEQSVQAFNLGASPDHQLQVTEFLPEPFVGDPASPVLLLSNNPGYSKHSTYRKQPEFMTRIRDCIRLKKTTCPFYYLAPDCHSRWWRQKLKCLLQRFGDDVVAKSVCNVVFFPYVSKRFGARHCKLPSQKFSFRIVSEAMERGAVIVVMRKGQLKHWNTNVPGLGGYDKLILLRNPRMPAVSPKNCDTRDYEKVVAAIEAAEMKRRNATTDS